MPIKPNVITTTTFSGQTPSIHVQGPSNTEVRATHRTVSVAVLKHRPHKNALKAAIEAHKLSQSRNYEQAAVELEKAASIDPQYAAAFNNLGVQYLRIKKPAQAFKAFQKTVELDPSNGTAQANLSVMLVLSGHLQEAERTARHAIWIDSSIALAEYVLGYVLAQRGEMAQAAMHLERAAGKIPNARKALDTVRKISGELAARQPDAQDSVAELRR